MMLWWRAAHVIAMVCWFAGLFYLPRLFVYHVDSVDLISRQRFVVMERRLYYGIMYPAGLLTSLTGLWLLSASLFSYLSCGWMQCKLALVMCLWTYHLCCGAFIKSFKNQSTDFSSRFFSSRFFRWFNEIPTVLLIVIVCAVIVKP